VSGLNNSGDTSGTGSISESITNVSGLPLSCSYVYTLSDSGCVAIDTVRVYVVFPAAPTAIVADNVLSGTLCINTRYQNFHAATPPSLGTAYVWGTKTGNATIAGVGNSTQDVLVNFDKSGLDTITLGVGSGGKGCNVYGYDYPVTIGSTQADTTTLVIYYESNLYCLNNSEMGYQWGYDSSGSLGAFVIPGQTYQNYYLPVLDTPAKHYWVETWNNNGCIQKYYLNTSFLSTNDVNSGSTGLTVYPNPAGNVINMEQSVKAGATVSFRIFNVLGQEVMMVQGVNGKATADISLLPAGSYTVESLVNGVRSENALFIKK
jgi:hypothetical protein